MKTKSIFKIFALGSLLALSGCGETELYSKQSEADANVMIAILRSRGIESQKLSTKDDGFTVMVSPELFGQAVDILRWYGYPREISAGVKAFYENSGIVSSPQQERARYTHAISEEIAASIEQINGINSARVHAVIPEVNPFGKTQQVASVGVLLVYDPRAEIEIIEQKVQELLAYSIEGLSAEKTSVVSVATQEWEFLNAESFAMPESFLGIGVHAASLKKLKMLCFGFAAILLAALGVIAALGIILRRKLHPKNPELKENASKMNPAPSPQAQHKEAPQNEDH